MLTAFGYRFVRFINQRELTGWDRLIASAAVRHPDLPGRFYAAGPGRAQQMLEAIIAEAIEAGTLRACDPQEAADELAGLWLGMTSPAIKLGARPPLSDDEIKQRVERALDVFLRAYSLGAGLIPPSPFQCCGLGVRLIYCAQSAPGAKNNVLTG